MIEVFPYSSQYRDEVVSIILPIQQDEFGVSVTLADQPDLLDIPGFYQRDLGNFWVAVAGGKVVGTISLLDIGNSQAALRKMFVKAPYRGPVHGVASRLLGTLLQWCEEKGVGEIYLGTTARYLAAHRFYEKNGFVEVPKSALPSAFPIMAVDTKFYKRNLRRAE